MQNVELTARREALGLTQSGLAELLNINQTSVGQWERARYKVPIWLDAELTKLEDMVDEMVEAMTSTIIESEKRTGEIPVQPRNERSVSILERVAAARAQYALHSLGIDVSIVKDE